ncbi:VWA domain-containing protein [Pelobacter propionicus]|uniref:von Willebrand factor, type A n=1 Tax=Pelobacter propionicus (strain DSM 2379 / NBRC 103807 / OttBd1) TaxID=338966 RepID=A1ANC1_PELPD|nr:VWA domain-containing protein [Pelobacter propionicus]ABK98841.1 von Willebrand factor, type A [Pelobacter propionicus DSM 2379]
MNLEHSGTLWLLLAIPCFLCSALVSHKKASTLLYRFAQTKKRPVPAIVSTLFLSLALAALILALAGPRLQYTKTVFNRSGIDLAIGIDVSKSMLAEDETLPPEGKKLFSIPNRLNRARYCALTILSALKGERVGVFLFASKGVPIVPLTNDYGYCQYILKHANDSTISTPGSDLGQAITTGIYLFEESSRTSVKSIVLISDGEDINEDSSVMHEAAQRAAAKGIAIYTVGTGRGQGVMVPIRDAIGAAIEGYYQDEDGSYLKTRLEQDSLKSISNTSGGRYFSAHVARVEEDVVDALLKRARTIEYTRATELAWYDLSPALLGAALLFLLIGIIAGR